MVVIVNTGAGYNYKQYRAEDESAGTSEEEYLARKREKYPTLVARGNYDFLHGRTWESYKYPLRGINVHISTAGPIQWSFQELAELMQAVEEAREALEAL